jgi:hypothetical protein
MEYYCWAAASSKFAELNLSVHWSKCTYVMCAYVCVCVCVYHSSDCDTYDFRCKIIWFDWESTKNFQDNSFSKIICNVLSVSCYQEDCEMCLGTDNLIGNIEQKF